MTEPFYHTAAKRQKHAQTGTRITLRNGNIITEIAAEAVISYYNDKHELLVSPVTDAGVTTWEVYLPASHTWTFLITQNNYKGDYMP